MSLYSTPLYSTLLCFHIHPIVAWPTSTGSPCIRLQLNWDNGHPTDALFCTQRPPGILQGLQGTKTDTDTDRDNWPSPFHALQKKKGDQRERKYVVDYRQHRLFPSPLCLAWRQKNKSGVPALTNARFIVHIHLHYRVFSRISFRKAANCTLTFTFTIQNDSPGLAWMPRLSLFLSLSLLALI